MRIIQIELTDDEYAQLEQAAERDTRTIDLQVRHYIRNGLRGSDIGRKISDALKPRDKHD